MSALYRPPSADVRPLPRPARRPRWEIVRTDAGWHARFIAANGQKIVASEVYVRRRSAVRAVCLVTGHDLTRVGTLLLADHGRDFVYLREVDER